MLAVRENIVDLKLCHLESEHLSRRLTPEPHAEQLAHAWGSHFFYIVKNPSLLLARG